MSWIDLRTRIRVFRAAVFENIQQYPWLRNLFFSQKVFLLIYPWPWADLNDFLGNSFWTNFFYLMAEFSREIALMWFSVDLTYGEPSDDTKPLPEPMLTQICVAMWHY